MNVALSASAQRDPEKQARLHVSLTLVRKLCLKGHLRRSRSSRELVSLAYRKSAISLSEVHISLTANLIVLTSLIFHLVHISTSTMSEELGFLSAARYGTRHLLLPADRQVKISYGSSESSAKAINTSLQSTLLKVSHDP